MTYFYFIFQPFPKIRHIKKHLNFSPWYKAKYKTFMDSKQKPSPSADTKSVPNQFLKHFKFQLADAGRTSMGETVLTIEIGVYFDLYGSHRLMVKVPFVN